jgi:hypothetical protein
MASTITSKYVIDEMALSQNLIPQSSKSFSSLLIGCVRRPTPRTDKGSSSITDYMITFNGIYLYAIY